MYDLPDVLGCFEGMAEPVQELFGAVETVVGHEEQGVYDATVYLDADSRPSVAHTQDGYVAFLDALAEFQFRHVAVELPPVGGAVAYDHVH